MTENLWISVLLGFAWLIVLIQGIALFALANHIGSRYVYTAEGVSRTGPKIGQRLSDLMFLNNRKIFNLEELQHEQHPTLLLFLPPTDDDLDSLYEDLGRFAEISTPNINILVFTRYKTSSSIQLSSYPNIQSLVLDTTYHTFLSKLGILVTPFAILLDKDNIVTAKGLVNNIGHLCLLMGQSTNVQLSASTELRSICSS